MGVYNPNSRSEKSVYPRLSWYVNPTNNQVYLKFSTKSGSTEISIDNLALMYHTKDATYTSIILKKWAEERRIERQKEIEALQPERRIINEWGV